MARILSISYDPHLLLSRELLLQQMGHQVVSAEGFARAYRACDACNVEDDRFDLIILGHSIPYDDKREMIKHCTRACSCPVLALVRSNEGSVEGAAVSVESLNPQAFVTAVRDILGSQSA